MICLRSFSSTMEMSALGGLDLKLSVPSLQSGMKAVVFILPAMRSGRSVKNMVTGLTPVSVNSLFALLKVMPFELCTNRNSASFGISGVGSARATLSEARDDAATAAVEMNLRRVVMLVSMGLDIDLGVSVILCKDPTGVPPTLEE